MNNNPVDNLEPQIHQPPPNLAVRPLHIFRAVSIRILKDLSTYKATLVVLLVPILAAPLLALDRPEARCAYVVVIMAFYWMFEVMPLAATALIPTFAFPMLGVAPSKEICKQYLPDTNFLFIGGLVIAVAVEKCNLHERIALRVLTLVGSKPQWIMLGFMSVTGFLSMWISNTATTAMMVPIAESVVYQIVKFQLDKRRQAAEGEADGIVGEELKLSLVRHETDQSHLQETKPNVAAEQQDDEKLDFNLLTAQEQNMAKGLLIAIAFGANIGGTGTITGTPPNIVAVGLLDEKLYPDLPSGTGVTYATWMGFAIPLMLISLLICWLCLVLYFLGFSVCKRGQHQDDSVNEMLMKKFRSLPPMSFAEWSVLIMFIILLLMWLFREPKFIDGFGELFAKDENDKSYFRDATSAMFISTILFAMPNELPDFLCFRSRDRKRPPKLRGALMDWPSMQARFPWSVVLLLGGGFAMADGVKRSGLSRLIGDKLTSLEGLDTVAIQFICVFITMFVTNICSNTVTATIFVPIVDNLARGVCIHPLALILPTTLACSYAFTLPVATPPNAIVFASGMLKVTDLMKSGMLVTLISAVVIVLNMQTYSLLLFDLNNFPVHWVDGTNCTSSAALNATQFNMTGAGAVL